MSAAVGSVMRCVDNKSLPWETRLALLTEATDMQAWKRRGDERHGISRVIATGLLQQ